MTEIQTHVTLLGKSYELKPYSTPNEKRLKEAAPKLEKMLNSGQASRSEYYRSILELILKDGAPDIDYEGEDFDAREAESAILAFFPPSMQAMILLTGFLE